MKTWLIGALVVAMVSAGVPAVSEAKRLGGGKSTGMQRDMPARTSPQSPPAQQAAPAQQANPGTPAAAAAPAAAAGKRSWMGPIAGLAAGLGLAALFSSLGMGAEFANFIMMALLGVAAVMLVLFLVRRFGGGARSTAMAGAGAGGAPAGQVAWRGATTEPVMNRVATPTSADLPPSAPAASADNAPVVATSVAPVAPAVAAAFVPASFDAESFARTAKLIFIRLQTANDSADLNDLRTFTTPELFAELRLEIQERGAKPQRTDVLKVDAEVLDVAGDADRQIVSVRFRGQVVEEEGGAPSDFNEIWHLVKPNDDSRSWAIAGIEQSH